MKIILPDGNYLLVIGNSISHSDFSGKVNLRKEVRNFIKSQGGHPIIKTINPSFNNFFYVLGNEITTYMDILKFACFLAKRAVK